MAPNHGKIRIKVIFNNRQPCYFATPPVQLILALEVSLTQIVNQGMDQRFELHKQASKIFKDAISALGFVIVPKSPEIAANALTAVYFKSPETGPDFLKAVANHGVIIAGGLHPVHKAEYFRVGHMNISATDLSNGHLESTIEAIKQASS